MASLRFYWETEVPASQASQLPHGIGADNEGLNDHYRVKKTLIDRVIQTLVTLQPAFCNALSLAQLLLYPVIPYYCPHGVTMKKVIQPLAWFVILGSMMAAASGLSLWLV